MNVEVNKKCEIDPSDPMDESMLGDVTGLDESAALALKNVYFFFGLIFRYPDEGVYTEIQKNLEAFNDLFLEYGHGSFPSLPPIFDLQAEYVSLFVNNKGFIPALPYASSHMDKGQLMGKTYFRIKHILQESGFCMDASAAELEDHLAILMESSAGMVHALLEKKRDIKNRISMISALKQIASCVENWVDDFAEKINEYGSMDFYKDSSEALKNFIHDADNVYEQVFGLNQKNDSITGVY